MKDLKTLFDRLQLERRPGDSGPYSREQIVAVEDAIGRELDADHHHMLTTVGGTFGFADGADLEGRDLDVTIFFGAGRDDYNIANWWVGYCGQIPVDWYPIAQDHAGDLYLVTSGGAVNHVVLKESLWSRKKRPSRSGKEVAASFDAFLSALRLPTWAQE